MNNTVCLCGSTRFLKEFEEANTELTKRGFSVITIAMCLPKDENGSEIESGLKDYLDLVHFNKILKADAIFVVGDGYFGRSTAREILWADMQGKPIIPQSFSGNNWTAAAQDIRRGARFMEPVYTARAKLGLPYCEW